jgi:hypothetical protein
MPGPLTVAVAPGSSTSGAWAPEANSAQATRAELVLGGLGGLGPRG